MFVRKAFGIATIAMMALSSASVGHALSASSSEVPPARLTAGGLGANRNKVSWYMPAGSGTGTLKWLEEAAALVKKPAVATGVYYCCSTFGISATGHLVQGISDEGVTNLVHPLKGANYTVHFVLGMSGTAIKDRTWENTNALSLLASQAAKLNYNGYIVDYEPSSDYTSAHKQAYADFLTALSKAMHAVGKESGFNSAGWGILEAWSYYRTTNVDICTSMTPTYNYLAPDAEPLKKFVLEMIAPGTGMPHNSAAAGIGTMLSGRTPEWNYYWTGPKLEAFTEWLMGTANLTRMDFWRADLDHNYGASSTETFDFEQAAKFIGY